MATIKEERITTPNSLPEIVLRFFEEEEIAIKTIIMKRRFMYDETRCKYGVTLVIFFRTREHKKGTKTKSASFTMIGVNAMLRILFVKYSRSNSE
jgi:hypothetical protein